MSLGSLKTSVNLVEMKYILNAWIISGIAINIMYTGFEIIADP